MPIEVFMPALSPTMEVGTLSSWQVKEGDSVAPGDVIAEIETDKATMEVEAIDEGTVGRLLVAAGTEDIPVGRTIALLLEEGEDAGALDGYDTAAGTPGGPGAGSAADGRGDQNGQGDRPAQAEAPAAVSSASSPAPSPAPVADDTTTAGPAPTDRRGRRVFASPLARRIARQRGVDLATLTGSGPRGRIVRADVEAAEPAQTQPAAAEAGPAAAPAPAAKPAAGEPADAILPPPAGVPYEEVKLSGMRKVIARRMTQSKQTVPHFYLTVDVGLDELLATRKALNAKLDARGVKLSVNDFLIKASALALVQVPDANVQYAGDTLYKFTRADISVAVAVDGGLITPVIRDAGTKGLATISAEMKDLAARARSAKLAPEDYQGGTFSLSNLGMFGIREFGAVINPPQGAILAVGQGERRFVPDADDQPVARTMMTVTLAVDHRALDGAIGAQWLAAFKALVEDPMMMMA
ncbi:pyruvate dehydrogenase E2 component (dihydrolipoamide acetyltransferase) [Rhodothalassium salexigens DSM 2132]|uniref:Acetyltransferase component of pyruvate dehydrogenase complex n=3 Tax=Rhodothalassium salexigens TaxID=1086 RepID=A0A4R2PR17_RHOSA|nr:pyruvate dehydrogenase complex dihydrolipoamide acetyltransferase [Rhodothalassium salexigens]MBB4210095.1 pyruvate dehydrogenase E2 component (dihydrolipoamide acetyltransferase) [Rhodothalassium salexigens DSM 2132]TCP38260.1 pyruvate dehydrogenase E2 component (dihydrolipoamide acetyltransferase) [Rhodothalassium salexigens DSM 2132]